MKLVASHRPRIVTLPAIKREWRGCRTSAEDSRKVSVEQMVLPKDQSSPQVTRPRAGVRDWKRLLRLPAAVAKNVEIELVGAQYGEMGGAAVDHGRIQNSFILRPKKSLTNCQRTGLPYSNPG